MGLQLLYRGKFDQKRKVYHLNRKLTPTDYKSQLQTVKFTNRLEKTTDKLQKVGHRVQKTIKVRHRLQSLPIYYKRLQKSDKTTNFTDRLQKTTSVHFLSLQRYVGSAF